MTPARPPRWARRIVEALISGPKREYILGDLEEMYARRRERTGRARAVAAYLLWGLRSAPKEWRRAASAGLLADFRTGLRQFRSNPRVFVGSSAVLALGLGGAALAWGIPYGSFDHGLPVSEPDRMVSVQMLDRGAPRIEPSFSVRDLEAVRASGAALDAVGLFGWRRVTLNDGVGPPARLEALRVSPSLFGLLEVSPLHGRALVPGDSEPGAQRVAVVDFDLWQHRYDGDPGLVGRTVRVDGQPTQVVGVLPPEGRLGAEALWLPIGARGDDEDRAYWMFGRARPGVTREGVTASLTPLGPALSRAREREDEAEVGPVELRTVPFAHAFRGDVAEPHIRVLLRSGVLILLLAVANTANLFLVRARTRTRELSVQRALGASRFRILRQVAVEAALPAVLGVLGGAALAAAGLDWYEGAQTMYARGERVIWQDWRLEGAHIGLMLAGALLSTVVASIVAGLPELGRSRIGPVGEGTRTTSPTLRLGRALVGVEIAAGGALLFLAALMIQSGWNLETVDWGFARESVMTGRVVLPGSYDTFDERLRFWRALEDDLRSAPGAPSVTVATQLPLIRYNGSWDHRRGVEVEGWEFSSRDELPEHYVDAVTPSFFRTFEAPLREGRGFTAADAPDAEPVVVVNASFARRFFPEGSPLGKRLRLWTRDGPGHWRTVVGVAPHLWMDSGENAIPEGVYVPLAQAAPAEASVGLRGTGPASDYADVVREAVARLDADVPVVDMLTMPELIRYRTTMYRKNGPVFIWIGLAALVLAMTGIYAVVSYIASLRTAEFGIRAALGAPRRGLVSRSIRPMLAPVTLGLTVGVVAGLRLTDGFSRMMFEVDPWSPGVAAASFSVLVLTALSASLVPAMRATRLDLVRILNSD